MVQGKGLLATEAPMTIPLIKAQGCVPVLNEVFFEFEHQGNIYHLHELELGKVYSIIISQKGGLYRYRIGDRVRVTHYYLKTPCLEFLGRTETTSDLVGEKLHEDFVQDTLNQLHLRWGIFSKSSTCQNTNRSLFTAARSSKSTCPDHSSTIGARVNAIAPLQTRASSRST